LNDSTLSEGKEVKSLEILFPTPKFLPEYNVGVLYFTMKAKSLTNGFNNSKKYCEDTICCWTAATDCMIRVTTSSNCNKQTGGYVSRTTEDSKIQSMKKSVG
jgi:hypothetical protein